MKKALAALLVATPASFAAIAAHAQDTAGVVTVEVFANSAMHVTPEVAAGLPYQLTVYRLDAVHNIEAQINRQLPQTEAEAQQWIAANGARLKRELAPHARDAAEGMTQAVAYRLNRLPAIVINRKVIVYGVTDATQAIGLARNRLNGDAP